METGDVRDAVTAQAQGGARTRRQSYAASSHRCGHRTTDTGSEGNVHVRAFLVYVERGSSSTVSRLSGKWCSHALSSHDRWVSTASVSCASAIGVAQSLFYPYPRYVLYSYGLWYSYSHREKRKEKRDAMDVCESASHAITSNCTLQVIRAFMARATQRSRKPSNYRITTHAARPPPSLNARRDDAQQKPETVHEDNPRPHT
eukprot:scaffold199465_cov46-Tisochrysis_lutea.AAC.3